MKVGTLVVVLYSQNQKVCILSVSGLQCTNFERRNVKGSKLDEREEISSVF